jgi:hypothetical protein
MNLGPPHQMGRRQVNSAIENESRNEGASLVGPWGVDLDPALTSRRFEPPYAPCYFDPFSRVILNEPLTERIAELLSQLDQQLRQFDEPEGADDM